MKTFADFKLQFTALSDCATCRDGYCSNTATLSTSGEDYNVEIFTNPDFTDIQIVASSNSSSTSQSDFDEYFSTEQDAVKFLCNNFSNFKCL